jgi:hypothetical protein
MVMMLLELRIRGNPVARYTCCSGITKKNDRSGQSFALESFNFRAPALATYKAMPHNELMI